VNIKVFGDVIDHDAKLAARNGQVRGGRRWR